jgi:hypothetical protein
MARYRPVLAVSCVVAAHAACLSVALAAAIAALSFDPSSLTGPVAMFTIVLAFGHILAGASTRSLSDSYRAAFFVSFTGSVVGVLGGLAELVVLALSPGQSTTHCWGPSLADPTPPPTNLMIITVAIGIPFGYALIGAGVSLVGRAVAEYRAK